MDGFESAHAGAGEDSGRRWIGPLIYFLGIASSVIAIVVATLINRAVDTPSLSVISAQRSQNNASNFAAKVNEYGHALKGAASKQNSAAYAVASAMSDGDPVHDVQMALNGVPDGLRGNYNDYLSTIDDITNLVATARSELAQDGMATLHPYITDLAKVASDNFSCLESLALSYRPSSGGNYRDVRCMVDAQHYYVLGERLAQLDSCETGIGRHLRNLTAPLNDWAQNNYDRAQEDWVFLRPAWDNTPPSANAFAENYWAGVKRDLDRVWCVGGMKPTLHKIDEAGTDTLYPKEGSPIVQLSKTQTSEAVPVQSTQLRKAVKVCGLLSKAFGRCAAAN